MKIDISAWIPKLKVLCPVKLACAFKGFGDKG